MVAEGIGDAANAPAVWFIADGTDRRSSGGNRAIECGVRIIDDEDHAHRGAAEGFGAEVLMGSGFVSYPEIALADGEVGDNAPSSPSMRDSVVAPKARV